MFPALVSEAGKHKHIQRHILSFVPSEYRRIARVVLRECPEPDEYDRDGLAQDLALRNEFNVLKYEIETNGMNAKNAIHDLLHDNASAEIIVIAIESQHCSDNLDWIFVLFEKNRSDVFALLEKKGYPWDLKSLCSYAWGSNDIRLAKWIRSKLGYTEFGKLMWNRDRFSNCRFSMTTFIFMMKGGWYPRREHQAEWLDIIYRFICIKEDIFEKSGSFDAIYYSIRLLVDFCDQEICMQTYQSFKQYDIGGGQDDRLCYVKLRSVLVNLLL